MTQAFHGTEVLDSVDSLTTGPIEWWKSGDTGGPYHTSVVVRRKAHSFSR